MSDETFVPVDLDEQDDPTTKVGSPDEPEVDVEPAPRKRMLGTSIVDEVTEGVREAADDSGPLELPVGKIHRRLFCRYTILPDERVDEINRKFEELAARRKKVRGRAQSTQIDSEVENERSAMLLASACDTLLWKLDDGTFAPLDEVIREERDDVPEGPLRYDRFVAKLFNVDVEPDATQSEIALEMHRWGQGHSPVRTYASALNGWMSGGSLAALEAAFQGN